MRRFVGIFLAVSALCLQAIEAEEIVVNNRILVTINDKSISIVDVRSSGDGGKKHIHFLITSTIEMDLSLIVTKILLFTTISSASIACRQRADTARKYQQKRLIAFSLNRDQVRD